MKSPADLLDQATVALAAAARNPDGDAIHDVRVAIRRLRQYLHVFPSACSSRKLDRGVHKVLRAGGEVRNFDIAIKLLKHSELRNAAGLARELRKNRRGAAMRFRRASQKFEGGGAAESWRLDLLKHAPRQPLEYARSILPPLAAEFFEAGEAAVNPAAGYGKLHKFRIQGRKFRYTLELFESDYGASLLPRMRALRALQKRLGDINDYVTTGDLLNHYRKGHRAVVDEAIEYVQQLAAKKTVAFRRYWRKTFDARQKNDWMLYFSGIKGERVA